MNSKAFSVKFWQDRLYKNAIDPATETVKKVEEICSSDSVILDFGAGAGEVNSYQLKGRCKKIIGVDFDPRVVDNPLLDEGLLLTGDEIPLPDSSVDIIFSIYVFEHVQNPEKTASELNRVLKPGGVIISLTPSKWHYVSLAASMTPLKFHKWFNRNRGFSGDDTFPTCYRLNTQGHLKKNFGSKYQWDINFFETQPNYLKFNVLFFLLGVGYERVVNSFDILSPFRVNMIIKGEKPK